MNTHRIFALALLILACVALPIIAEEAMEPETVTETEMVAVDDFEPALDSMEAEPAAATDPDWWGNGAVSYRNYIPVADVPCEGDCTYCDKNMICCKTGCPCANCQYICDDCHECPPPVFDKIFFDLDESVLRPESKEELDKVVAFMESHPGKKVLIEGHCCDLASDSYNMALGRRRAVSAKEYLVAHGVRADRMITQSYGEERPWVSIEQRPLNRRAVIIVLPDGTI